MSDARELVYLSSAQDAEWNAYVDAHPDATLYHRAEWRAAITKSFGHDCYYLAAKDRGRIVGVLPMVHTRSVLFGSILCSMPFLNFGGVLADDPSAEAGLLDEAGRLLRRVGADYLELRHLKRSSANLATKTHKVSMVVELPSDPEVLFARLDRRRRHEIRQATESRYEIRFGGIELLDDFYDLLSLGWRNLGTPIYRKGFFANICQSLGPQVEITVVYENGRPVSTAFDGAYRDTLEGMWTYTRRDSLKAGANTWLYWNLLKRGCERGYRSFHLGRSTVDSGGQANKRKWTAEPRQLYWEYMMREGTAVPELDVQNPKYRLAISAWRRLPVPVTRWIGPFLARSIP